MYKVIRSAFLVLVVLISGCTGEIIEGAQRMDVTVLWHGFTHEWKKGSHHLDDFGSWVQVSDAFEFPKDASLHHTSRSTRVYKKAHISTYYDIIQANFTKFKTGVRTISSLYDEGEMSDSDESWDIKLSQIDEHIVLKLVDDDVIRSNVEVVLNGFRLYRRDIVLNATNQIGFRNLGILEINIEHVRHSGNEVSFNITGEVMLNCQATEECGAAGFGGVFDYQLDVHYLVIASESDENHFNSVHHDPIPSAYSYVSGSPDAGNLGRINLTPMLKEGYEINAIAIAGFRYEVTQQETVVDQSGQNNIAPEMNTWNMWLTNGRQGGSNATNPTINGDLFYKHKWNADISQERGQASFSVSPIMLQFKEGKIKRCTWSVDNQQFRASPNNPDDNEVSKSGTIETLLKFECL